MAAEICLSQLPSLVEDPTAEFQRGGQTVSKITLAIVSIVWLAAGVCFFIALPNHSSLWLINIFNETSKKTSTLSSIRGIYDQLQAPPSCFLQQIHTSRDSSMSTPARKMRQLLKDKATRKAARKANEATGSDPSLNKEAPGAELRPGGGALAVVPIQAVDSAAVSGSAQHPVINLEMGAAASQGSGKRGLDTGAEEANTGKKRPRTRQAGSTDESHGESLLATKEIPAPSVLPIRPALLEEGEAVVRDEQSRLINRTWENGRGWRDETYKALTIRCQVEFAERLAAFSAPQPIVDRPAAKTGFRPKFGQDTAPWRRTCWTRWGTPCPTSNSNGTPP
ncbi:uncharacterized protein LOC133807278 isoform X1 [Humulus lupulus]|uniref:uncharacterized protein LOC133807278 isoform X1 n=1 Tax=Humulus lupulus TaxID=3486 RepID=UPI002B4179C4|nr:uncharacterized protein LOC133807278 isoform X1 [Humulus lupulus]